MKKAAACVRCPCWQTTAIDAIVAAGMGMRPMMGFQQAGITVYFENQTPNVGEVAKMAAVGTLPVMGAEHACHH